ncbi:MAG: hypothetical protein NT165_00225 [Candidatus Falkowbacteria bacterium]|nr:hypothetical protein [Candidatus Falkowbacteria bacterium]
MKSLLIGIDGPDGSGKTNITRIITSYLRDDWAKGREVVSFKPTYFETTAEALLVKEVLEATSGLEAYSREHNEFYLEAMRLNYLNAVIPSLENGKIVILDSSEIRALAFNLAKGNQGAINHTKESIKDGTLNSGIIPDVRIFIDGSPETLLKNLKTKKSLDHGDPINLEEVSKRRLAYFEAIAYVNSFGGIKRTIYCNLEVNHHEDPENYLHKLVSQKIKPVIQSMLSC